MSDDRRAVDVLAELEPRATLGGGLVARLGARAWAAPRFAKGRALFPKFGLPDPWDPEAPQVEIGLGDVALPERRPVAPHATPPPPPGETAAKKPLAPNVPWAPQRTEAPAPAKGRPAPQIGETRKFDPKELTPRGPTTAGRPQAPAKKKEANRAFGPAAVHHPVAKLPVRPGVAPAESSSPADPPVAPSPAQVAQATRRAAPPPPSPPSRPAPAVPTTTAAPLLPPPPPPPPAEPPRPAPPVNRRPPAAGGGGLDDLFGMGSGDNTRIKLPKADTGDAPRPRRPVVSSPEELAKLGLDRRPPPAKPPAVTPAPPSSPSRPPPGDDDLPDE